MKSIDQLNSDLEAVKQAHKTDAERWSQRSVPLHRRLKQNNSELSRIQSSLKDRESEVTKDSLRQQHLAVDKSESILYVQLSFG